MHYFEIYRLHKPLDIVSCEVKGIILALENVVEYCSGTIYRVADEVLYIMCDCDRAIESILKGNFERNSLSKRQFEALISQLE